MKVGVNMEIYKGYYSDKKYQFIYNIEYRKEIDSPTYKNIFCDRITIYDSKYNH